MKPDICIIFRRLHVSQLDLEGTAALLQKADRPKRPDRVS